MTRVAAVDCGTNSIRLLVADVDASHLTEIDRGLEIVRLGQGVDKTGRLDPAALARTFTSCRAYAKEIEQLGVERVRFVATSASRDAENRSEFVAGIREILGVTPEIIGHQPPYLVVDIGGGSTEFVLGEDAVHAARSVDIGCVRLTERHLRTNPPTTAQVAAARADIAQAIDQAAGAVPLAHVRTLVGLAGSVTTVAAIALGLDTYDPTRIHHTVISSADVRRVSDELLRMTHQERAALPVMHPGRVDVIGAGALILAEIVDRVGVDEVVVSEHDILDGIAWALAGG
jgi:exopolyphosphatase/guanosine-5'-triphosphate,3'-diphosphate pyrophosphatase